MDGKAHCHQCELPSTLLYPKFGLHKDFTAIATTTCGSCGEEAPVSAEGICKSCTPKGYKTRLLCRACLLKADHICASCTQRVEILTDDGSCPTCRYMGKWDSSLVGQKLRDCIWCGERRIVNPEGVCLPCHVQESAKADGLSLAQCQGCGTLLPDSVAYCTSCGTHTKICSCGREFMPDIKEQRQCPTCLGICRKCKNNRVTLSDLCDDCQKKESQGVFQGKSRHDIHDLG